MNHLGTTGMFPLPAISLPLQSHSHSRRVVRRSQQAFNNTLLANNIIHALNTLHTSFSNSLVRPLSSQARNLSSHSRMLAHIYSCATRYLRCQGDLPSPMSVDHVFDSSFSYSSLQPSALPLVAARVSLPASVGSAQLLDLLPSDLQSLYSSPNLLLRPTHEVKKVRKAVLLASPSEYVQLIQRLYDLGMIEFTQNPKVINGVFGVPKDGDSIRLIIDARPANAVFIDPPAVRLPTPDLLSQLVVPADQPFYVAKVDLDNYYHRLTLPGWMRPYFALPSVRSSDIAGLHDSFGPDAQIYPCCKTLPMGWSHSVFIAQAAHEHLLNTKTALSPTDRIASDNDFNLDRIRHQVYIDDLNLFGHDPSELSKLQQQYIKAAAAVGLPVKPSKVVAPTANGVECLGLLVNGTSHELGLSVSKMVQLCHDTIALINTGYCTGRALSQIVGKWTWAALANRPLLSVLSAVYRFIECSNFRTFTLWNSVKRELSLLIDLAPLFFTTLKHQWFDRLIVTDACETGQGVVATKVDPHLFPFLSFPALQPQLHNWSTIVSSPWKRTEHINSLEIRAVSTAIKWVLSFAHSIGSRVAILSDSLVTVYSIMKGRSSSPLLLPRLRQIASMLLSAGLRLFLQWIPTELNPADAPSRAFEF